MTDNTEYTPTTGEARAMYITGTPYHIGLRRPGAEFDRWLAEVKREVAAEAWDEGYKSGHSRAMRYMSDEPHVPAAPNPYRSASEGDNQ